MSEREDPKGEAIAAAAPGLMVAKATLPWARMAMLAVLAGAFIAFGSIAYLVVQAVSGGIEGPAQLLSGVAFSAGLLMVMVGGAELFTGNTMFALPCALGKLPAGRLLGAWGIVWIGNLVGSVGIALLFAAAGGTDALDGLVGAAAAGIADDKFDKGAAAVVASGVLANILVCLAVWLSIAAPTIAGKAIAIVGPVTVFVAAGFEHSVANMSLLPIGMLAGSGGTMAGVAENLLLSTIGNIVGGAGVALALGYGHRWGKDEKGGGESDA